MIEDLLDVSRIARGTIRLEPREVDATEIIEGAIEKSRPLVFDHNHDLRVNNSAAPLPLWVDPARMEQVVTNLINNAAKYTPDGGEIVVCATRVGEYVSITVRDNGIGIAPEALPNVFDLFVQVNPSSDRAGGGLGIGLNLVQKIVQMHGGEVRAASGGVGRGSEFTIRLPMHHPAALETELAGV